MITVSELIAFLQTQPQDLPVAYRLHSEQALLKTEDIDIVALCYPRVDGWVADKRPDKPSQMYLRLPGI